MVKNLPAVWETWVQSLGREDPLEKGIATHSIILAWRIPWTEEPGGLQGVGHNWATNTFTFLPETKTIRPVVLLENEERMDKTEQQNDYSHHLSLNSKLQVGF